MFLAYEREAFLDRGSGDLRITFDENIRARTTNLSTTMGDEGIPLPMGDKVLMEIKTVGGIPLWMTHLLSEQMLFRTPFSKYGMAYKEIMFPKGEYEHDGFTVQRTF